MSGKTNLENSRIPWARPVYWGNEIEYVNDAVSSGWISGGIYVERLEKQFAEKWAIKHSLAVSNGTTALHLAYLGLGLEGGDEIIVPAFGYQAAANIALHMQLTPVFADVDSQTWCLSPESVAGKITSRTRAIVAVHSYGNVCAMNELIKLSEETGIPIIEDVAEAIFSELDGKLAGTFGVMGTLSFHATKTITTGEGGMVITNDREFAETMWLYRSHGLRRKIHYLHEVPGHNFRLTNIQAALGCAQMEVHETIIDERKKVHSHYVDCLEGQGGIEMQVFSEGVEPVLWTMAVKIDPKWFNQSRELIMETMANRGIETRPGFVSPKQIQYFCTDHDSPVSKELSEQVICLPTYPSLKRNDVERICNNLLALRSK